MFEHLDDGEELRPGTRDLARVLDRAEAIRSRRRWTLALGSCAVLLAASVGFFFARSPGQVSLSTAAYQFNLQKGPLPIGLPVPTTALVDVQFATPQTGFALALHRNEVVLATSTDGGSTWQVRNNHLPAGLGAAAGYPGQMEFVGFTGYLWGARNANGAPLWVTHDDGTTWQEAAIGPYVLDVSAIGPNAWALTDTCAPGATRGSCTAGLEESLDGGTTWTAASPFDLTAGPPGLPLQPVELARITRTRAYVLVNFATTDAYASWQLQYTDNAGATWAADPLPCGGPFALGAEVAASSTDDLWLFCGSQASGGEQSKELFRSEDGGSRWTPVALALGLGTPPPPSSTKDPLPLAGYIAPFTVSHRTLAVASPTTAWLYPQRAGLYETQDGGETWAPVPSLLTAGFNSGGAGNITFLNASEGWICAYGIGLWHTNDGVHWSSLGSG
jgi:photosystem II stability/assembly factor-like uncharacterized protein